MSFKDFCDNIVFLLQNYGNLFLVGTGYTLLISAITVFFGTVFGALLAIMRRSNLHIGPVYPLRILVTIYVEVIRGTPMLLQLYFFYFLLPSLVTFLEMDAFTSVTVACIVNSTAYVAEIIRAAIESIDKGQMEASRALGLTHSQAMRLVIIPQAYRRMIPPICNEFVMVLKDTSLVSIIALTDLTYQTKIIASNKASALVYIPAMIIYLIITGVFTFIFNRLEKRLSIYE